MRLLNVHTRAFEEFDTSRLPNYAILSHTWGDDEVSFKDMQGPREIFEQKAGFKKIEYTCEQAKRDSLDFVWCDTCCIDKSSSAELSEAINSMFEWYSLANICHVYLSDFEPAHELSDLEKCRWFTRGWTLQELLAPRIVCFYGTDWQYIGTKSELRDRIHEITAIPTEALELSKVSKQLGEFSVAQRMSWAAKRQTTRTEDLAYCLLGLFSVNMSMLYGEGRKAFVRLQEEILRETDDQSVFAWSIPQAIDTDWYGMFAPDPSAFAGSGDIVSYRNWTLLSMATTTSSGLSISLSLGLEKGHTFEARLNCQWKTGFHKEEARRVTIILMRIPGSREHYTRVCASMISYATAPRSTYKRRQIHILQKPQKPRLGDISYKCHVRLSVTSKTSTVKYLTCVSNHGDTVNTFPDLANHCFSFQPFGSRKLRIAVVFAVMAQDIGSGSADKTFLCVLFKAGGPSGDIDVTCGSYSADKLEPEQCLGELEKRLALGSTAHGGVLELIDTPTRKTAHIKNEVDESGSYYTMTVEITDETYGRRLPT